ncbi:MAG TPA: hypothetical protein VF103_00435 [Polyangiaceae bacterium]
MILARTAALVWLVAAGAIGCNDEVSLGAYGSSDQGSLVPLPECGAEGDVGTPNAAGVGVGITIPTTDWAWAEPFDSLEWEVRVEVEPTMDGYLWAEEFTLGSGNSGLVALQAFGGYQADPPAGPTVRTKIVQFWMNGPPIRAELGDIAYPDARAYLDTQVGVQWWTINARYDWQTCRAYRFSLTREETEPTGGRWYAARVRDTVTGAETLIGRILAPEVWGRLTTPTRSWTNRIGWNLPATCDGPEAAAALFGRPAANGGALEPTGKMHRFAVPPLCPSSRFTDFPNAVRQEVGQLP